MKRLLAFVNSFCTICELLCNIMSHCTQVRPVFSPYNITESFSCTSSLLKLRFPHTGLLFQDINSHRTMFQCYDCLEVLNVTGPWLKVTGQTFKGLPFTGHVFMYSVDFPRRVFGGCTVYEHRSVSCTTRLCWNCVLEICPRGNHISLYSWLIKCSLNIHEWQLALINAYVKYLWNSLLVWIF